MSDAYFVHPQEVWDLSTCEKKAKYTAKDGLGTPYPFKGYIGTETSIPPAFGKIRYNGGCVHNGQWYEGEIRRLPSVAPGYEIVRVPRWGWQIKKCDQT